MAVTTWQWDYGLQSQYISFTEDERSAQALATKIRGVLDVEFDNKVTLSFALDHVNTQLNDHYFDGVTDNGELHITAPETTRLHRAMINWNGESSNVGFGRFSVMLADESLINDFNDWTVEQVFDGARLELLFGSQSKVRYSYLNRVQRIYGNRAKPELSSDDVRYGALSGQRPVNQWGSHNIDFHLIELLQEDWQFLKLISYYWNLDHKDLPQQSSQTLGALMEYKRKPGNLTYRLRAQAAFQVPKVNNINSEVFFYSFEFGLALSSTEVFLKHQEFESKGDNWFRNPFAYAQDYYGHYWQYNAGSGGLINQALGINWRKRKWRLQASYHQFKQSKGQQRLGNQWLVSATYRFGRQHNIMLRSALFNDKTQSTYLANELNKFWLIYSYQI